MKSLSKSLLTEMALDLGDTPDFIDPEKRRKIERGQHPYSDNPAFPREKPPRRPTPPDAPAGHSLPYKEGPANRPDPTRSYNELISSHVYPEIIRKVSQYTGRNARQLNPQELMMTMQQAMMQAVRAEARHRPQLEQAAVEVVLGLPEFRDARAAVEQGALRIEARLLDPQAMMQAMQARMRGAEQEETPEPMMQVEPGEENEEEQAEMGLNVPQIRQEFDAEAQKRRFINMMIQGAAINKNYAYHEVADQLRQIDPNLLTTYGKMMSIAELMYWMAPEDVFNQMMGTGQGGGGMEEVDTGEDGVPVIRASALSFPVLIQELAKGLYEYLSYNEDDPDEVRNYAANKSDTLSGEQWDIMQGPGVWRHFNHLVNQANGTEFMGRVYRHIVTLPTGEFNELMQEILRETPRGRQYIQQLVNEIRAEEEGRREESKAYRLFRS
jgi:hypothetical protein